MLLHWQRSPDLTEGGPEKRSWRRSQPGREEIALVCRWEVVRFLGVWLCWRCWRQYYVVGSWRMGEESRSRRVGVNGKLNTSAEGELVV